MADIPPKRTPQGVADERVAQILRAADSWAADAPASLTPSVRAVCIRLAEMIADTRHQHRLTPEPLDTDAQEALKLVAERLRAAGRHRGLERELEALTALELRATGSWATVAVGPVGVDRHRHHLPGTARGLAPPGRAARRLLGR